MRARGLGACRRAAWLAGSAAVLAAVPAGAQAPNTAEPAATDGRLADIVVTAERRATALQDTPISIIAVTQETVEAKGIDDLQDLATFTPNLNITASRGSGNNAPSFSIRGISGGGGTAGSAGERGVGLYIDGIFVPRTSGSVLRVLDVDRIEVLRGPQGTLFGRNSTGGAIRIFTRQPEDEFGGYIRVTGGSFDRTDIVGTLNVPITGSLAVRGQAAYLNQDGFVERGTQMLGGSEDFIGRLVAKYEPSDATRVTLGFLYSDSKADGTPLSFVEFDMRPGIEGVIQGNFGDWMNDAFKAAGQPPLAPYNDPRIVRGKFKAPETCLLDDFNPDFDRACEQFNNNEYWQVDLSTEFDLSDTVTLSTVSGYSKLSHQGVSDWQLLGTEYRRDDVTSETIYQELQLNSQLFGGALDLVTGLNYFYEDSSSPGYVINRRGTSVFPNAQQQAAPGFNINSPAFARGDTDAGLFRTADAIVEQKSNSLGVFASGTWHATDRLDLTGGLRFAYDHKDYQQTRFREVFPGNAPGAFMTAPGTDRTTVEDKHHWTQLDYRATVDYDFTDDIMAYATISKAYKAGQYSFTIAPLVSGAAQSEVLRPISPEKVINYEAGSRMTLFDRRLRFNPTFFYMQWSNRQAARQVACSPPGQGSCPVAGFNIQVIDSGDVNLWGVELDVQLAVTDNLILDGSGALIDYDVKDPVANTGPNLYPDVPSPTFNVGATYNLELGFGRATFNLNYAYVGEQATHPTEGTDSSYTLPDYGLVNARIQFVPEAANISVSVFANNLLDNTYGTYGQRFGGGYWDAAGPLATTPLALPNRSALAEVRGRPREVGVTLQYNF